MKSRVALTASLAAFAFASVTGLAFAASTSNTDTANGNTLSARVTPHSGNDILTCSGRNQRSTGADVGKVLVSYRCQWQASGGGGWRDAGGAEAQYCTQCSGTGWNNKSIDLCDYVTDNQTFVLVRTVADGYWRNQDGEHHYPDTLTSGALSTGVTC